jgi:threonine dehydrogenase-like Zn-dependent dehydrogenase
MKALVLLAPGKTELREIGKPVAGEGEVLLRVARVGFCGGDLNGFRGTFPLQEYPMVLGHEIGAVIEECGPGVPERFAPGMKTTVYPYRNCGECISCRKGKPNACFDNKTMGVRRPGAMTGFIAVPWQDLFVSEALSLSELALVEPLTVGFHAVDRGEVTAGEKVAVIGCGIVGLGAVAGAAARGAEVIAVDIEDGKIGLAQKAGAKHGVNSATAELHEAMLEMTGGDGPDVIIEAVGSPATYRMAVEEVAFTGRVVYIGYGKAPVQYETRLFVQKELTIRGSRNCMKEVDFPAVMKHLEGGQFPVNEVISRRVSLDDAGAAMEEWNADPGAICKVMLELSE